MKAYSKNVTLTVTVLALAAGVFTTWRWWQGQQDKLPEGLAYGNGRIESDQISIATKSAGRVQEVLVREGDLVSAQQLLAFMDATELEAQRAKYVADLATAQASLLVAQSTVAQRKAEYILAQANLRRANASIVAGGISEQERDQAQSEHDATNAALISAEKSAIASEHSVVAAQAMIEQVDAQIADTALSSPVRGRVLYRLAYPGEVISAGGGVLTVIDLTEIYMEIYLPLEQAVRIPLDSEARILLDGLDFAIPARVTFVSPEAQFTPKQVETRSERDKLVFRVKLRVPPSLVERHIDQIKTGSRGLGYVRLGSNPPEWPDFLQNRAEGDPLEAGE